MCMVESDSLPSAMSHVIARRFFETSDWRAVDLCLVAMRPVLPRKLWALLFAEGRSSFLLAENAVARAARGLKNDPPQKEEPRVFEVKLDALQQDKDPQ